MSFDVNIKGTDNLPIPTTADPETHGDRIAAKAEFDEAVRDIIQDAVDEIAKLEGAVSVIATGTIGEIGPISLVYTPTDADVRRAERAAAREAKGEERQKLTVDEAAKAAARGTEAAKAHPTEAATVESTPVKQGTATTADQPKK